MLDAQDFEISLSEEDDAQLVVARAKHDGRSLQFLYARPIGRDTWFKFMGMGASVENLSSPSGISNDVREAADEAVYQEGYPIRTIEGKKSPEGKIELFFGGVNHIHAFFTHPNTFSVYRTRDSGPARSLGTNETHIEIVEENEDLVKVEVESGGTSPPEYAIKEAVRYRYHAHKGIEGLPSVQVK
jgi:hypothetical protein